MSPSKQTSWVLRSKTCQSWALENQEAVNFLDPDLIAFVDARSVKDQTFLLTHYARALTTDEPIYEDDEFGVPPREQAIWYDYRIDYRQAIEAITSLTMHEPYKTFYPTYFGRKETLTDQNGIFDVARAALTWWGKILMLRTWRSVVNVASERAEVTSEEGRNDSLATFLC